MILCMRSNYFVSALAGGWEEGETKVMEIAMADAAAVRDMKLLLKLSYGGNCDTLLFRIVILFAFPVHLRFRIHPQTKRANYASPPPLSRPHKHR